MAEALVTDAVTGAGSSCVLCQAQTDEDAPGFCSDSCGSVSGEVLRRLRERRAHLSRGRQFDFAEAVEAAIELAGLDERIEALSAARRRLVALGVERAGNGGR